MAGESLRVPVLFLAISLGGFLGSSLALPTPVRPVSPSGTHQRGASILSDMTRGHYQQLPAGQASSQHLWWLPGSK